MDNYIEFIKDLDSRLETYFKIQADYLCCKKGCSACCEKGDYPLSESELKYLMQGYASLDNDSKIKIQENIKEIERGGVCPFLINKECSIYPHRPIICRVHGIAYLAKDSIAKIPYCVNDGKNFASVYENGILLTEPIKENLDTVYLAQKYNLGEVRNLYDWIKS